MWPKILIFICLLNLIKTERTAPGIDRTLMYDGVRSAGYNLVYGDEDLTVINQVVNDAEKSNVLKNKFNLNEAIPPLPSEDVKCLMSVDKYCSKKMGAIKSVLIQALKEDCVKCSSTEKEAAGRVAASMMAHDPVAWKLFLTRSALQIRPAKPRKEPQIRLRPVGKGEEVVGSNRFIMPGVKVRVKRYQMERI